MTIEPFHGDAMKIYKLKDGRYECDFVYPTRRFCAHAGWNAAVGQAVLCRRRPAGQRRIVRHTYQQGRYVVTVIEEGVGPLPMSVIRKDGADYILSANHTRKTKPPRTRLLNRGRLC